MGKKKNTGCCRYYNNRFYCHDYRKRCVIGFVAFCFCGLLPFLTGCPVGLNRVPGDTELLRDKDTGAKYYLYIPSWHNNEQTWPVIVTCHGTNPWDTAWAQIHEWRRLAEKYGLIVIAPVLEGVNSEQTLSVKSQLRRQRRDERVILSVVHKTIMSLNGDPNRVYMVGWSGGGYAVYYTGLRNPQVFRALVSRMGSFDAKFLPDVAERIDPYQPVAIFMAARDIPIINKQCRAAYNWLKEHGMKRVRLREITGVHQRRPKVALDYFKEVTSKFAFVRVNAVKGVSGEPRRVQFYVNVAPEPRAIIWEFGDGRISNEKNPQHFYKKSGKYNVKVIVITARGAKTERRLTVDVK